MKKKLALLAMLGVMCILPTSCGKKAEDAATKDTVAEQNEVEIYRAKVQDVMDRIQKAHAAYRGTEEKERPELVTIMKETIATVTPLYQELNEIVPPAEYAETHNMIKEGTEGSMELLNATLELLELSLTTGKENETYAKTVEIQKKLPEMQDKAAKMTQGLLNVQTGLQSAPLPTPGTAETQN